MTYETAKNITVVSVRGPVFVTNRVSVVQKSQLIELILRQEQETGLPTHAAVAWDDDSMTFVHAHSDDVDEIGFCLDDYV